MRLAGHVAHGEIIEVYTGFWWGELRERKYMKNPSIDGRIILRWIFRKRCVGIDWIELVKDRDKWGTCECGNEPSVSVKCGEYLD
jgi:hypothetical protein